MAKNTHPRRASRKLTLVSCSVKGKSFSGFFHCPVDENGKTVISNDVLSAITNRLGAIRGDTISIG